MPGVKTNEVAGTRAVLRHYRMSAYKARQVLDLIRGRDADRAEEILAATPREAARVISKVLASAVANARNNDQLDPDELYVSACYADEGTTLKRWRPRARGRATRIRKRTCHITVIVSRLPDDRLQRRRARQATETAGLRSRRVAASRRGEGDTTTTAADVSAVEDVEDVDVPSSESDGGTDDTVTDDMATDDTVTDDAGEVEASTDAASDEDLDEPAGSEEDGEEAATDAAVETEAGDEEPPAPKPRRSRTARKAKASADEDASDAGDAGDEEKG